ncbi:metallophosphoesterase [Pedobacter sp. SAFR-022]|uniref:metallophosphoesterase n=1 Tax=Pedobacter sp. SAFR-022 TaxID=3436861 RepID=UPI003F7E7097
MKSKNPLIPFLLFLLIFFFLNTYTLSGLQFFSGNPLLPLLFWTFVLLLCASLIIAFRRIPRRGMDGFFKIISHAFLILLVSEFIFVLSLAPGDIYRLILHQPRNYAWVVFASAMLALSILTFIYGMVRGKYAYRVIRHVLEFEDLPEAFDGFTITQISDVHAGSFRNRKAVSRGIDLINKQQADLFVFTGDLVNNKASEIVPWVDLFSTIRAPYGQFSVLGNHDYGDYVKWETEANKRANLEQLKSLHKQMGYRLLLDEHVVIEKGGQRIILAGVENWGLGFGQRGDLKKALQGTQPDDFKILLSHDPTHWESEIKVLPAKIHLTLAGHTHGMQFGLEAFGIKWSPVKYRYAHWAGIKEENGRYLNINRGFGFLGFSGRVGIWPEITVIELRKKP